MEKAAENPDGGASSGMGMGMGFAMANQIGQAMQQQQQQGQQQSGGPPPPPSSGPAVYIAVDGETTGPFNAKQLTQKLRDGALDRSTMVWMEGMDEWAPAGEVDALQALLKSTPPPPPPA
jgi:hypothetical protein